MVESYVYPLGQPLCSLIRYSCTLPSPLSPISACWINFYVTSRICIIDLIIAALMEPKAGLKLLIWDSEFCLRSCQCSLGYLKIPKCTIHHFVSCWSKVVGNAEKLTRYGKGRRSRSDRLPDANFRNSTTWLNPLQVWPPLIKARF